VSGKPMDRRRRKVRIPIGIEKVLCAAAGDPVFRESLVTARGDALGGSGLALSASETMILRAVPEAQLRTMIENIDLERHRRRRFFRGIAAASLAATTLMGTTECTEVASKGVEPDEDFSAHTDTVDTLDGDAEQRMLADEFAPPDEIGIDLRVTQDAITAELPGPDLEVVFPEDVVDVEIDDVNISAGIPPQDVSHLDVDVQPMPAGIPPMDVSEE
jgi:hypothetical protein